MRRYAGFILVLSYTTLLVLQTVGLHMHANPQTEGVNLHAEHVHGMDPDGHDHSADVDVSIVELGAVWAKLSPMILAIGLLLLVPLVLVCRIRCMTASVPSLCSTQGLRPPLRAPPLSR